VADVEASKRFYAGALAPLGLGIAGEGEGWFSADELFVSGDECRGRVPRAGEAINAVCRFQLGRVARDSSQTHGSTFTLLSVER
jgi:hypothetical protein